MESAVEDILGNKARIRLLRSLYEDRAPRTGRRIARELGLSHTHVINQMHNLENRGIIIRTRVGPANTYTFNEKNYMVRNVIFPLFEAEKRYLDELVSKFSEGLKDDLLHVFLFGSMAKGTSTAQSDIHLVLVVKDDCQRDSVELEAAGITADAMVEFGHRIDALVFPRAEFERKVREGKGMWEDFDKVKVDLFKKAA